MLKRISIQNNFWNLKVTFFYWEEVETLDLLQFLLYFQSNEKSILLIEDNMSPNMDLYLLLSTKVSFPHQSYNLNQIIQMYRNVYLDLNVNKLLLLYQHLKL